MPVVPRLNTGVREAGFPNVRISPEAPLSAFGGGESVQAVGNAVQRLGETGYDYANEVAKKAREHADQIQLLEYKDRLGAARDRIEFDKNNGFRNKKKKAAMDGFDLAIKDWDDSVKSLDDLLHNDRQRFEASKMKQAYTEDLHRNLNVHVAQETRAYDTDLTEAFVSREQSAAAKAAVNGDLSRLQSALSNQIGALEDYGRRNGMYGEDGSPDAITQQAVMKAVSKTHENVLNEFIGARQDKAAKEYYDLIKDTLDPDASKRIQSSLRSSFVEGESQRQADVLISKYGSAVAATKAAAKIDDAEVRKATEGRIKDHFTLKEHAERMDDENSSNLAARYIDQGKTPPVTVMEGIRDFKVKKALSEYRQYRIEGGDVATKSEVYYGLQRMMSSSNPDDREAFKKMNLLEHITSLNTKDYREIVDLQRRMRTGELKVEEDLSRFHGNNAIVDRVIRQYGMDPTPKEKTSEAKFIARLRAETDRIATQEQIDTGKKISDEKYQSIIEGLMTDVVVGKKYLFFDDAKKLIDVKNKDAVPRLDINRISENEKLIIQRDFDKYQKSKGRPARKMTDQELLKAYSIKLRDLGVYGR